MSDTNSIIADLTELKSALGIIDDRQRRFDEDQKKILEIIKDIASQKEKLVQLDQKLHLEMESKKRIHDRIDVLDEKVDETVLSISELRKDLVQGQVYLTLGKYVMGLVFAAVFGGVLHAILGGILRE